MLSCRFSLQPIQWYEMTEAPQVKKLLCITWRVISSRVWRSPKNGLEMAGFMMMYWHLLTSLQVAEFDGSMVSGRSNDEVFMDVLCFFFCFMKQHSDHRHHPGDSCHHGIFVPCCTVSWVRFSAAFSAWNVYNSLDVEVLPSAYSRTISSSAYMINP